MRPGRKVKLVTTLLGNRHGRDAQNRAFHSGRDGAGIQDVVTEVHTLIDARDKKMRSFGQDIQQRQIDAVHWGTIHGIDLLLDLVNSQRLVQGDCMSDCRTFAVRRHHPDVSDAAQGLGERGQSRGVDAVVIGHEDARA